MSGGWGTPTYQGRHREGDSPPEGAICIEEGCQFPATRLRPAGDPWLYEGGVIEAGSADEWVCALHVPG